MIGFVLLLILAIEGSSPYFVKPKAGCSISLPNLDPEPIVVTADTHEFIYPEPAASSILLNKDQKVLISCPGGTLTVASQEFVTVEATCVAGSNLAIEGETVDFNQITCSKKPVNTARYTGSSCELNAREIEIGFSLTDTIFVRQIRICFDNINQNTLYATHNLTRSTGNSETNVPRPSFVQDDFYNVETNVDTLYTRATQRITINRQLGLPETSTKYIADTSNYYLCRGHLSAKATFVYAPQQIATFHYVNVAPQWQTFNGANWEQLEQNLRDHAELNGLDLVVYTGTYGISTLPHEETGEETQLFLYVDSQGRTGLPVPELCWKVVYNPATKAGVALVGINNPYQTDVARSVICEDIQSQITWLNWKPDDLQKGYSYACTYDDLRAVVPHVPELDVRDILS